MPAKKGAAKPAAKKAAAPAKAAPAKKTAAAIDTAVYVKGLNFPGMSFETIKAAFKPQGEVKDICLRRKKYCILYFKDASSANKAKELNGKTLKGQKITVEAAKKKLPADRASTCTTVFVGNLPAMTHKQGVVAVKKEFAKCGTITKVRSYRAGHAFVYFADNAAAKKAVTTLDNQTLGAPFPAKTISVKYSIRTKALDAAKEKARKAKIAKAKKN